MNLGSGFGEIVGKDGVVSTLPQTVSLLPPKPNGKAYLGQDNGIVHQLDATGPGAVVLTVTYPGDSNNNPVFDPSVILVKFPPGILAANIVAPSSAKSGTVVGLKSTVLGGKPSYSYSWQLTDPLGSTAVLSNPGSPAPSFTPDVPGSYLLGLTVTDSNSQVSSPTFAVVTVPSKLVASILAPSSATSGTSVTLDSVVSGGKSPYSYFWQLVSRPQGSTSAMSGAFSASVSITPDSAGTYVFELSVADSNQQIAVPSFASITVV